MPVLITRCPLCQTAFRVTGTQLGAADGLARCGACTHVFRVADHLVSDEPAIAPPVDETGTAVAHIDEEYIHDMLFGAGGDEPAATAPPLAEAPPATNPPDAESLQAQEPAQAFAPPPIEIESPPAERRRGMLWGAGCLLAALLLFGQYAWHERDRLVRDPGLRPRLDAACAVLGCTLPRPRDVSLIRGDGLVIRPAPGREGVLLVDALLSNRAAYPQAWPALEIVFSDLHGRPFAGRAFLPAEYLPASPRADMPVGQAIPVHLELRDPGERATNYRLSVRDPAAVQ